MNAKDRMELTGLLSQQIGAKSTLRQYVYTIGKIDASLAELRMMPDEALLKHLNGMIMEKNYCRRYAFRYLLSVLGRDKLRPFLSELVRPPRKNARKNIPFVTIKSMVRRAKEPQEKLLIMLLTDTGARVSAIVGLTKGSVEFERRKAVITIVEHKTGSISAKYLSVPTSTLLKRHLASRKMKGERIFSFGTTERARQIIRKYRPQDSSITPHCFRHTRAITLLRENCDLLTVADMLDHRSLDSTRQYLRESGVSNREVMKKHAPKW